MFAHRWFRGVRSALSCILLLLASAPSASAAPVAQVARPPVKLVVLVAIDGLSWRRLHTYAPWFESGLKRLLAESQVETECRYAHLNTETGPGHAALGTGAPPRVTGIVANRWFEASSTGALRRLYCTDQPDTGRLPGQPPLYFREVEKEGRIYVFARKRQLELWQASEEIGNQATTRIGEGPEGKTLVFDSDDAIYLYHLHHGLPEVPLAATGTIPGPANLRVPTLGDRMVAAKPGSRVVSLSGKDRGAIFLAGKDARHVVYWYDRDTGRYLSSAAYDQDGIVGGAARDLVRQFNAQQAGVRLISRFGTLWKPLPKPDAAAGWPQPAPNLGRYQIPDLGIGFDHDLSLAPRGYFDGIYTSPLQDQLLADLALAFLSDRALALGRRGQPDLLALSFSAQDVVSHTFGNESEEELDTLRRLDRDLGRLLTALDALADEEPRGSVVLALSADHGFTLLPEVVRRDTGKRIGGRLQSSDTIPETPYPNLQERLNRALADELCLPAGSQPIFGSEGWIVAYDRTVFPALTVDGPCGPAGQTVGLADLDRAFPRVVRRLFGEEIEEVLLTSQRDRWLANDPAVPFARNDDDAARSGDAFLIPREGVLMHWDPERGSGHGSHHEADTHVPLLFWGGPFRPGERSESSTPYDLAPTLADILGITLPDAVGTSRVPPSRSER
jgi:hypothetical protein